MAVGAIHESPVICRLGRREGNGGGSKLGTPKVRRLTSGNPSRPSPTNEISITTVGGDLPDAPPFQTATRTQTAS